MKKILSCTLAFFFCCTLSIQAEILIGGVLKDGFVIYQSLYASLKKEMSKMGYEMCLVTAGDRNEDEVKKSLELMGCTHVITIGKTATDAVKNTSFPGLFTFVEDPVKDGLIDNSGKPLGNLTGISMTPDYSEEFKLIKAMCPSSTRIGVIYDPSNSYTSMQKISKASEQMGFFLSESVILNPKDVLPELQKLHSKIDFLLALPDTTIFNKSTLQNIFMFSLKNKLPIIGFSSGMSRGGAFLSFYPDYEDMAAQASEIMVSIIKGTAPASLSLRTPRKIQFSVNQKFSKLLKIEIPDEFIEKASEIFQ